MKTLPRYMRVAVVVAVASVLGAVLSVPSTPAARAATPTPSTQPIVYQVSLLDSAGHPVYQSPFTSTPKFQLSSTATPALANALARTRAMTYSPSGHACWQVQITALSGWFHSRLYTLFTNTCWQWWVGRVANTGSFSWMQIHASNWSDAKITNDLRYFYVWRTYAASGYAVKVDGQAACVFVGIPGACGFGHPWIHFYAHGDGSFYWSGGVN